MSVLKVRTAQHGLMRDLNKASVLSVIRRAGGVSKSDIAGLLKINKTTVTACVRELLRDKLVKEVGLAAGAQGRPPLLLEFDGTKRYVIGISLEMGKAALVITNLRGDVMQERAYPIDTFSKAGLLNQLTDAIRNIASVGGVGWSEIAGAGIGSPGIVRTSDGMLLQSTKFPNIRDVPLKEHLEEQLGLNVLVEENATAAMMGEVFHGRAKHADTLIYLHIGTGIGSGILIKGGPYQGSGGYAPKLGHTVFEARGKACGCGNRGCYERYASELALVEFYSGAEVSLREQHLVKSKAEAILSAAMRGDRLAHDAVMRVARNLGVGIGSMLNIFNPDHVIIGSRLCRLEGFLPEVISAAGDSSFGHVAEGVSILPSSFEQDAVAIGAASLAIEEVLSFPKWGTAT